MGGESGKRGGAVLDLGFAFAAIRFYFAFTVFLLYPSRLTFVHC